MDNNDFNSLGLDGVTLHEDSSTTDLNSNESNDSATQAPEESAPVESTASTTSDDDDVLNDLSDEETINLFIEGIMQEKGVNPPSEEVKQTIHEELKNRLLREIDRSLVSELPDEKLEELNRMATSSGQISPETIVQMIKEANLDVTDIVGTTMARFRDIYLGESEDSTKQTEE